MLTDYLLACGLVLALCALMICWFNKVGYAFTWFDGLLLVFTVILAFTVPMGIGYALFSILR